MAESKLSPLQWWTEELFLEEEYRDTAAVVSSAGHHRRLSLSPRVVKEKAASMKKNLFDQASILSSGVSFVPTVYAQDVFYFPFICSSLTKCVLIQQGYLDEQFCQVEDLQDEASPNFVEEVVTLFFKDSGRLMSNIEQALEKYPRDFNRWDAYMQQLKGSCSSIGASRMKNECMSFRDSCGQGNVEGCMRSFQKVKREHAILRQKLESYFQLLRQAGPAGAATRPVM
uniref:Histidine-containing phosphotransfer protein n=1 Tax=Leersia perrieri TaxID=77586 RepID=A0A0D9V5I6_9ORYZ